MQPIKIKAIDNKSLLISWENNEETIQSVDLFSDVFTLSFYSTYFGEFAVFFPAFLAIGFTYFSYLPKIQQIDELKTKKSTLEQQLSIAKTKAAQLEEYRAKMKKAQEDFMIAKAVLPETKEIPSLLTNVSQSGQAPDWIAGNGDIRSGCFFGRVV